MPRRPPSFRPAGALCAALVSGPALGQDVDASAAREGPAVVSAEPDAAPLSPFRQPASRSPSGTLYDTPFALRPARRGPEGAWFAGSLDLALRSADADEPNAAFRRHRDPAGGLRIERLAFESGDGRAHWLEFRATDPGRTDQTSVLRGGRRNQFRAELSYSESPYLYSSSARSMWQGVGGGTLTLIPAPGVRAGGASGNNAANAEAVARLLGQGSDLRIGTLRRTGSAKVELALGEGWTWQSSYALERRRGTRPFGANEGNGETIEPVEYRTHDLRAAVQFAGERTQFNAALHASVFRNAIDTLSWENPFTHPAGALRILGGRTALAPDNEAYHLKLDFAQALPEWWRARLTAAVDLGFLRQNDRLIPPTSTSGIGAPFGTAFDGNYDRWNTLAALPRERAEAAIDTRLLDLGLSLAPADRLSVRASLRHHETRNRTQYTAFNPQTGLLGYIIQDTNPGTVYTGTNNVHYRSIPFAGTQDTARLAAEARLGRRASLSAELEHEAFRREHRERELTRENRLRLAYTDRGFDTLTLRLSWELARRGGSAYESNPYRDFYTESLPSFTYTRANLLTTLHNLEELRKFDLADRRRQLLKARVGWLPLPDLDLGLVLQSRADRYPADFGRSGRQTQDSASLDLSFAPAPSTALNAHVTQQWGRMHQTSVADLADAAAVGCGSLPPSCSNRFDAPRSIYPATLAWSATQRENTRSWGIGGRHDFGGPALDLQFTRVRSRLPMGYTFASPEALQTPALAALAGDGFGDAGYALSSADLGLRWPVSPAAALRLSVRHEAASVRDWHYAGLEAGTVVGTRVYLDAGPAAYRVTVFGVVLQLRL